MISRQVWVRVWGGGEWDLGQAAQKSVVVASSHTAKGPPKPKIRQTSARLAADLGAGRVGTWSSASGGDGFPSGRRTQTLLERGLE